AASTATTAEASADGSKPRGAPGTATPAAQNGSRRSFACSLASNNGATTPTLPATPPAQTSGGGISVAAAIAVNIASTTSSATLPAGISVGAGALTISSAASTDAKADADGTATAARAPPSGTNIGAAIAINLANVTNSATVAGTANGPTTVKALVTPTGDGRDH